MKKFLLLFIFLPNLAFAGIFGGGNASATSIQGIPVSATPPSGIQCLVSNSGDTQWAPGSCSSGSGIGGSWSSSTGNVVTTNGASTAQDSGTAFSSVCTLTGTQTLTNKTLTSPAINSATWGGTTATGQGNSKILITDGSGNLSNEAGVTASQLPNPGASSLGGVQSIATASHNFMTGISTSGVPSKAQPAWADLSDPTISLTQLNNLVLDAFTGHLEAPTAKTYFIDYYAAFPYTINSLNIATVSGTATVAVKIGGTNVTGISSVSVSSSNATGTATAANTVSTGNQVTLVVSSISTPVDMAYTLKVTRN